MDKGQPVTITKVANGFLVRPDRIQNFVSNFGGEKLLDEATYVFPNILDLTEWLMQHFEEKEDGS